MAYIAFDLDNTLGFFELTNPLAFLWSPEFLENPEQSAHNIPLELTSNLKKKLKAARSRFIDHLLSYPEFFDIIIRPNIDIIFSQIIIAKHAKRIKAVIIYSNTGVTYSMELAKEMIEKKYNSPDLINLMADHWHPLRVADRPRYIPEGRYVQPEKTIKTLKILFHKVTGEQVPTPTNKIMFMDDRTPKHKLQEQEAEGLTYIVPKAFYPEIRLYHKRAILFLAFESLQYAGVLSDKTYLSSGFCNRIITSKDKQDYVIKGFPSLYKYVWNQMFNVESSKSPWIPDTISLSMEVARFLEKI